MPKVTTVINQKGGTGKTTTTVNLGSALTKLGQKVLLIDLDPQANLSYSFGINNPTKTISDVLDGSVSLSDILIETEDIYIAPAAIDLADIEISMVDLANRESYLHHVIKNVVGIDHILIDSPPSLSVLALNALYAADEILIPLQMEVLSLRGLMQLLATVEEFEKAFEKEVPVKGIVAIRYNSRTRLSGEIQIVIRQNTDHYIFNTKIRENIRISEAPSHAQSVLTYAPDSIGATDFLALATEFLEIN